VSKVGLINITILRGMVQRLGAISGMRFSSEDQASIWRLITQHFMVRDMRRPNSNGMGFCVEAVEWLAVRAI
jgi:hypothetical protein